MIRKKMDALIRYVFKRYHPLLDDRSYASLKLYLDTGKKTFFFWPRSFNEKIQYLKLRERNFLKDALTCKVALSKYVKSKLGEEYIPKYYAVVEDPSLLNFESLPEQFVAKSSHASGHVIIVRNKSTLQKESFLQETEQWLKQKNYNHEEREWIYSGHTPLLIIEELLENPDGEIADDYKIHCFHGKAVMIQHDSSRMTEHRQNFYDINLKPLNVLFKSPPREDDVLTPHIQNLIEIAEKLSDPFNYVRVDMYSVEKKITVGELTFYPSNGFRLFHPEGFNNYLGTKIVL